MNSKSAPGAARVVFVSGRVALLRAITWLMVVQIGGIAWLLSLAPKSEWEVALGEDLWWTVPAGLIAFGLVLPAAVIWLHDRYVVRMEVAGGTVVIQTFLLWGTRRREWDGSTLQTAVASEISGGTRVAAGKFGPGAAIRFRLPSHRFDLIVDRAGDFPEGEGALVELFGVRGRSSD
jgi:hypothetical protein